MYLPGPYASAILRFRISFPPTYPALPPLITFTTDIFHPLITPLTTYTYTTGSSSNETVSARDDERLPPGSFSLRDGFPQWFGRSRRPAEESTPSARDASGSLKPSNGGSDPQAQTLTESRTTSVISSRSSVASETPRSAVGHTPKLPPKRGVSIIEVLHFMRSSFENEMVLDSLPLEAAGNPGAWHAWRSHRARGGHTIGALAPNKPDESVSSEVSGDEARPAGYQRLAGGTSARGTKRPGEWSWDGVWEERVRRGIDQSNSDAVLYGNSGGSDDLVHLVFLCVCRASTNALADTVSEYEW